MDTDRIDFAGFALAPNVLLVKQDLARLDARLRSEGAGPLRYRFPDRGAKGSARPFGPCVDPARSGVDLYAGVGFGPFLDPEARAAVFGDPAASPLAACLPKAASPLFRQAGIALGDGPAQAPCNLSVYSASPFVLMVNKPLLEGRPVPTSWEDLLGERWRGQVLVTPEDPVCNVAYLGVYSMYGARGLAAFARNVACTASASVMGMLPAQPRPGTGCVYVAPWFFARSSA